MGGDHAPGHEIDGALAAVREASDRLDLILVGDESKVRALWTQRGGDTSAVRFVHAAQVITMEDKPTAALKDKRESSLAVGMRYHQEGHADAFVSAGNTGAVLSAATLILGRVKGVSRPTIGTFIPAEHGECLLLDAGTNVDCRAQHLYEFGVMGSIYFERIVGKQRPTVALLNVGEERLKGTEVVLEAHKMLEASSLQFVGNVEGRDILKAKADVVVCDGFVGNIVLKFGESVPSFLKAKLRQAADRSLLDKVAIGLARGAMRRALGVLDPNLHGGVPVLGVNGVAIIGHGSASPVGIKNMVLRAVEVAQSGLNRHIAAALEAPSTSVA
jgi:glycerol-3-phosphate acyltransferase PlsX